MNSLALFEFMSSCMYIIMWNIDVVILCSLSWILFIVLFKKFMFTNWYDLDVGIRLKVLRLQVHHHHKINQNMFLYEQLANEGSKTLPNQNT